MPSLARRNQNFEGVQALRLIAALLVVTTHSTFYTHERFNQTQPVWREGAIGVDIFFLISGFVMMATVGPFLNHADGWRQFMAKRILRIVPMYWLATTVKLATMLLIPSMVLHAELGTWTIASSYLFLPSTNAEGRFEPLLGVGWTLIFEMFFYAIFAMALFFRTNVLAFVAAILGTCSVIALFRTPEWPAATMYFDPIVLYFLGGMTLFLVTKKAGHRSLLVGTSIVALAIFFASLIFEIDIKGAAGNVSTMIVACLVIATAVSMEPWLKGRVPKIVLYFADASYVLYLFHPLVAPIIPEVLRRTVPHAPPALSVMICIAAALTAAAFTHSVIEKPVTAWLKGRFFSPRQTVQAAATSSETA